MCFRRWPGNVAEGAEGRAVNLVVGETGHVGYLVEVLGSHVAREGSSDRGTDRGYGVFGGLVGGEVAHDVTVLDESDCVGDPGGTHGGLFDLTQLDAIAVDLDLMVSTALQEDLAVGQGNTHVAGTVHREIWEFRERGEGTSRLIWTVDVAGCQSLPGDAQLAGDSGGLRHASVSHHQDVGSENG